MKKTKQMKKTKKLQKELMKERKDYLFRKRFIAIFKENEAEINDFKKVLTEEMAKTLKANKWETICEKFLSKLFRSK